MSQRRRDAQFEGWWNAEMRSLWPPFCKAPAYLAWLKRAQSETTQTNAAPQAPGSGDAPASHKSPKGLEVSPAVAAPSAYSAVRQTSAEAMLREGATDLIEADEMEQHNIDIFKGKWRKGAKAWSGEFIKRTRAEGMEKLRAALKETPSEGPQGDGAAVEQQAAGHEGRDGVVVDRADVDPAAPVNPSTSLSSSELRTAEQSVRSQASVNPDQSIYTKADAEAMCELAVAAFKKSLSSAIAPTTQDAAVNIVCELLRGEIVRLEYPKSMFPQEAEKIGRKQAAYQETIRWLAPTDSTEGR